jgi:uncharacterized protein YeaO (DUF488 family)
MQIWLKRAYDPPGPQDGTRVLVDRIWPRGLKKEDAAIDVWLKEIAPSHELREWFHHDRAKWDAFKRRYFCELNTSEESVTELMELAERGRVTLVFGAKDEQFNNAVLLKQYVKEREDGAF